MKKIILTLTVIIITSCLYGQVTYPDTTKKECKNVIEVNITGLIGQFLNLNTMGYYSYSPYMMSYKRIFKNCAIRLGVGGSTSSSEVTNNDTLHGKSIYNNYNVGLGYEHYSYLTKRWTLYFGIDAIASHMLHIYENDYSTTSSTKDRSTNCSFGASPFVGLVFRLNSRLSLSTETSYDISYFISESKSVHTPLSSYNSHTKGNGTQTGFNAPTSINIRIWF